MSRALTALVLLCASACGRYHYCRDNTIYVQLNTDAARNADQLQIDVLVDGVTETTMIDHPQMSSSGSVDIEFATGYPTGKTALITVKGLSQGVVVAKGERSVELPEPCAATFIRLLWFC